MIKLLWLHFQFYISFLILCKYLSCACGSNEWYFCSTQFQYDGKSKAFFASTKSDDIAAGYLIFNIIGNYRLRCIISNWICLYVANRNYQYGFVCVRVRQFSCSIIRAHGRPIFSLLFDIISAYEENEKEQKSSCSNANANNKQLLFQRFVFSFFCRR